MVVKEICGRIKRNRIALLQDGVDTSTKSKDGDPFNMYMFGLFSSYYGMKNEERYSYDSSMEGEAPGYTYSQQAIDLIWDKIKEDPSGIIDRL